MPRSTGAPKDRAAGTTKRAAATGERDPVSIRRVETLVDLCNYCRAAHRIAEAHGEKLLGYLLAMAVQEGADAANRQKAADASSKMASSRSK